MKFTNNTLRILNSISELGVIFLTVTIWRIIIEGSYTLGGDTSYIGAILLMVVVFSLTFKTAKYIYQTFKG